MKRIVVILGLYFAFFNILYSQQWTCNTISPNADFLKDGLGMVSYNNATMSSLSNQHKCISVYVHVVRNSSGNYGLSTSAVNNAITILRSDLNACNINIEETGRDFIDSDDFYYGFSDGLFSNLINTGFQPNVINIYLLAPNINYGRASNIPGLALVLGGNYAGTSVLSHEFGHCLGLYHTHSGRGCGDNANCPEDNSGNNCSTCGDLVCDTPADPCLSGNTNSSCNYIGGGGFNPDIHNIMSYASPACLTNLTNGQKARMHAMIENSPILQSVLCPPVITGHSTVCPSATYTLSNAPQGASVQWSVTGPFTAVSSSASSVSVTTTNLSGQSGTLSASVNNNIIATKTIRSCAPEIVGEWYICCNNQQYTLNDLPPGYSVEWSCSPNITPVQPDDTAAIYTVHCNPNLQSQQGYITASLSQGNNEPVTITQSVYVTTQPVPTSLTLTVGESWFEGGKKNVLIKAGNQNGQTWDFCGFTDYSFCWSADYGTISSYFTPEGIVNPQCSGEAFAQEVENQPLSRSLPDVPPPPDDYVPVPISPFYAVLSFSPSQTPAQVIHVSCTYEGCFSGTASVSIPVWVTVYHAPYSADYANNIIIYPNPVSSVLHFNPTEGKANVLQTNTVATAKCEVQFFNTQTGGLAFKQTVPSFDTNFDIDLSSVPDGIYVLRLVRDGEIVQTQNIIVQH